jgi:hypothetical protein
MLGRGDSPAKRLAEQILLPDEKWLPTRDFLHSREGLAREGLARGGFGGGGFQGVVCMGGFDVLIAVAGLV